VCSPEDEEVSLALVAAVDALPPSMLEEPSDG
jgi:hypothetical protein